YDIPLKTGRIVPGRGWVASDYIGVDQGPIVAMIANHRNGFVWEVMKKNPYIRRGLERAGFTGGWLAPPDGPKTSGEPDPDAAAAEDVGGAGVDWGGARRFAAVHAAVHAAGTAARRVLARRGRRDGHQLLGDGQGSGGGRGAGARFRARTPGHPGRGAGGADDRRAREAPDRVRGRCVAGHLPARQHLDPRVRHARRARAAPGAGGRFA